LRVHGGNPIDGARHGGGRDPGALGYFFDVHDRGKYRRKPRHLSIENVFP
jgi:hypothetical protein